MRLIVVLLLLAGCRTPLIDRRVDDGGAVGADADLATARSLPEAGVDLARPSVPTSCCGQSGNPGNELGVGKFCRSDVDCAGQRANRCVDWSGARRFCTFDGCTDDASCGSGAQCACITVPNSPCGCIPGECTQRPPGC